MLRCSLKCRCFCFRSHLSQAADDLEQGIEGARLIPAEAAAGGGGGDQAAVIDAVVQWVEGAMAKDRKVTALKTLQVRLAVA